MSTRTQNQNPTQRDDVLQEEEEEEEVLKLEEEVEQIAQKVNEYRTMLPDQLNSTLDSLLSSQRPIIPPTRLSYSGSEPGPESETGPNSVVPVESSGMASLVGEDQKEAEKIQFLKQKTSSNATMMPIVLKKMKDYMARVDKLELSNGIIHPAFKRKRTSGPEIETWEENSIEGRRIQWLKCVGSNTSQYNSRSIYKNYAKCAFHG